MTSLRHTVTHWTAALTTILFLAGAAGCDIPQDGTAGGLLGKVGNSLGGLKKDGGKLTLEGAAGGSGSGSGSFTLGRTDDGETAAPDPGSVDEPAAPTGDGSLAAECRRACETVVNCLFESCPALGTPDQDDVAAVVGGCASECEAFLSIDEAASVTNMSCSAVWAELTASEPSLNDACDAEGTWDYEYDYEYEGEFEGEAEWSYEDGSGCDEHDDDGYWGDEDCGCDDDDYGDWDDEDDWDDYEDWDW